MSFMKKYMPILLGIIFIISGISKAFNIIEFQKLIIDYGFYYFHYVAPFIVIAEIMIGASILLNIYRKLSYLIVITFLIGFTLVYTYAYYFKGITDCGCFGNIEFLSNNPIVVYIRNIILLSVAIWLYNTETYIKGKITLDKKIIFFTLLLPSIFISGFSYNPFAFSVDINPMEGKNINQSECVKYVDKSKKNQLLMFVSYNCPHCWNSMENYKGYINSGVVDTSFVYIVADKEVVKQEDREKFFNYFPNIITSEIDKKDAQFIEAYPSSFLIMNDTIKKVLLGTLPSAFVIKEMFERK